MTDMINKTNIKDRSIEDISHAFGLASGAACKTFNIMFCSKLVEAQIRAVGKNTTRIDYSKFLEYLKTSFGICFSPVHPKAALAFPIGDLGLTVLFKFEYEHVEDQLYIAIHKASDLECADDLINLYKPIVEIWLNSTNKPQLRSYTGANGQRYIASDNTKFITHEDCNDSDVRLTIVDYINYLRERFPHNIKWFDNKGDVIC